MNENTIYIIFTVVIGLCALLSPMLVALVNNKHQLELTKLEIENRNSLFSKEIIDGYFKYAGAVIGEANTENLTRFGEYSSLVYFYIPKQYHNTVAFINEKLLKEYDRNDAREMLEQLACDYSERDKKI